MDDLLAKFLDDRDNLSEAELESLLRALRTSPPLASRLKEDLVFDDFLSRRLGVDRRDFAAQMAQRLRDVRRGEDGELHLDALLEKDCADADRSDTREESTPRGPGRTPLPIPRRGFRHPTNRPIMPWLVWAAAACVAVVAWAVLVRRPAGAPPAGVVRKAPERPETAVPETARQDPTEPIPAPSAPDEQPAPAAVMATAPPVEEPLPVTSSDAPPPVSTPAPLAASALEQVEQVAPPDAPVVSAPRDLPHQPPEPAATSASVATLERVEGAVYVFGESAAVKAPAASGQQLLLGQGLVTEGEGSLAVMSFADSTRIEAGADTEVRNVSAGAATGAGTTAPARTRGRSVFLARGTLAAQVARQPKGQDMLFSTPHAEIRVLSTHLTIASGTDSTRVEVQDGQVQITRRHDGRSIPVREGYGAVAAKGVVLAARPVHAAAAPVIHPAGGAFSAPLTVTLATATPRATIRFTTDGSEPTAASRPYTGPLLLTKSATVKARAFCPGYNDSPSSSAQFHVNH